MKKPMYTTEEIHNLLLEIEKEPEVSIPYTQVKEHLSSFILENNFDPIRGLTREAQKLEEQAREIKRIVHSFKKPLKELPKEINSPNNIISSIARWRLKLGR